MTPKRAAEISNEISEGVCRASKKELMECVKFYSLRECELYQAAQHAYTQQAADALNGLKKFRDKYNQ